MAHIGGGKPGSKAEVNGEHSKTDSNGIHSFIANGSTKTDAASLLLDAGLGELLVLVPSVAQRKAVLDAVLQDRAACTSAAPAKLEFSPYSRMVSRIKAALLLLLVFYTFPVSLCLTATVVLRNWMRLAMEGKIGQRLHSLLNRLAPRGTAIVSGAKSTKGLHVCRHLHRAGWRVVLVDTHKNWASGSRFSSCVAGFRTTPIPNKDPVGYLKALRTIVASERATLFVPVSIAQFSVYEALAAELVKPLGCAACTLDAEAVAVFNDKIKFTTLCERLGLRVPRSFPVTSRQRLLELNSRHADFGGHRFLLKSIHYAATHRADMFTLPCAPQVLEEYTRTLDISPAAPWQLQQLLAGREFSCATIAHEGRVVAHADTEACLSNLFYRHVGAPQVLEWVEQFCQRTKATGQLCFDFMLNAGDGQLYSFECNPRTSSVVLEYHDHPGFAEALCDPEGVLASREAPLLPLRTSAPAYWLWNEVGELLLCTLPRALAGPRPLAGAARAVADAAGRLRGGVDAVLDAADPLPFLALHYGQVPLLLLRAMRRGNPWIKVDLCTGKLVELGGD